MNYICLALVLITSASAQSAANFDTEIVTPAAATAPKLVKVAAPVATKDAAANASVPSRYVGTAELESYLGSRASVFLAQGREKDPFGQLQDPDAKPKVTTVAKTTRSAPVKATPLSEIIQLITITTIMPKDKSFLVGTRLIKQGEEISLLWRGKNIRVQVTDVTSRQIAFKDAETGEIGARQMDMLPPGMRTGNDGIKAPGMVLDRPNAPIELETGEVSP
ncbi:MAG: hypothetical protein V4689_02515 [Verrucomicrobiota bacterium]